MINSKKIGIENEVEEENNSEVIIDIPFNRNDIKITTQPLTLGDLVDRLEYKEICLNSDFQRMPNLWDDRKKSRLIESVLLRLPIFTFYFDGRDDNRWEVIDGLQRISALKSFMVDKVLALKDLEFLKEYNGYKFLSLPRELQRRIKTFPITVYVLEKGTPDDVKYNIFSRLNQGGLVLNPQEIRNALHQGIAAELVADLARGKDIKLPDGTEKKATKEGKAFIKSMNTAWALFENDAFRKRENISDARKPINKALFDVLSVCFAKLSENECNTYPVEERVREEFKADQSRKYDQKINRTNSIAATLSIFVALFLRREFEVALKAFDKIAFKTRELIRPNRKNERKKRQKPTYPMNNKGLGRCLN